MQHLSGSVATINADIGTSGVGAGIGGEIDVCTLQFGGLCITTHRDHAVPEILSLFVDEVRETSVDIAGRDGVDASKVTPFVGKRSGEMDAASLCDVVRGLEHKS
jgi:hypothetical protein